MSTRAFIVLIVAAMLFGGALAGAFIGGTFVGEGRAETQPEDGELLMTGRSIDTGELEALRRELGTGAKLDDQSVQQMRAQMRSMASGKEGAASLMLGGVAGSITAVDGSKLTVDTPDGPVTVTLGDDTTLHQVAEIGPDDLEAGSFVTVMGPRGDSGDVEAQTITVIPEGVDFQLPGLGGGMGDAITIPGSQGVQQKVPGQ